MPIYLLNIGLNGFEIGALIGLFAITALFASFFIGILSDRTPIKNIIMAGFLISALFYYLITLTNNFILLVLIFFLGGIGANLIEIPVPTLIYKTLDQKRAGTSIGIYYLISTVASAFGFLLGGLLLDIISFTAVFKISAVAFLIITPIGYFITKNKTYNNNIEKYKTDLYKTKVFFLITIVFLFTLHWGAEQSVYSLYLTNTLGLTTTGAGIFVSIPIIFLGIGQYYVGKNLDKKLKPRTALYSGLILSGLGHIGFSYPYLISAFLFRIIHEIGDAFLIIFVMVSIYKLFPRARIGGLSAIMFTVMVFGRFIGSLIFAPMGTNLGYGIPLAISGAIMLFALAIAHYKKEIFSI
jgi:MFS transporter, DHA1 family, quinolone resistance protein